METEEEILTAVERDIFNPGVVEGVIDLACEKLSRQAPERAEWQVERNRLEGELENLAGAVAGGGDMPTLVAEMRKRETRRRSLTVILPVLPWIVRGFGRWRKENSLIGSGCCGHVRPYGQAILRDVIDGPINVRIGEDGPAWSALGRPERLLGQLVSGERWRPQADTDAFGRVKFTAGSCWLHNHWGRRLLRSWTAASGDCGWSDQREQSPCLDSRLEF